VLEPEAPCTLSLRLAQVAKRREFAFGRGPSIEQMQQGRDRRCREPQQHQGMQERHASSRNAMPNGMSETM